jgi:hypothetical protein
MNVDCKHWKTWSILQLRVLCMFFIMSAAIFAINRKQYALSLSLTHTYTHS